MTTVTIDKPREGTTLPKVDLRAVSTEAIDLLSKIEDMPAFSQDLEYLQSRGITRVNIARVLNIPRYDYFWRWTKRGIKPRSMYYILVIREWARQLREQQKEQQL